MSAHRLRNLAATTLLSGTALFAGISACSGQKNTELIVAIQTDLRVPKDLNAITVEVFAGGQRIAGDTYVVGPTDLHLPATIGLVPNDPNKLTPIDVIITGRFSNDVDETRRTPRVIRKARMTFAKDRVALVRMPLKFACYDAAGCADGQTCIAGSCQAIPTLEGATAPAYSDDLVWGAGGSNQSVGECWNADLCLASAQALGATADPCVFSLGGGDTVDPRDGGAPPAADSGSGSGGMFKALDPTKTISVVLAKTGGTLGFCSGGTCRVPLDQDANEGWDWADEAGHTTIRLAQGLCAKLAKDGLRVEGTDTCKTKVAELPFCDSTGPSGGGSDGGTSPDSSTGCPTGKTSCGGACVDMSTDRNNCGTCGRVCAPGQSCVGSSCTGAPDASVPDSGGSGSDGGGGPPDAGAPSLDTAPPG